MHIKLTFDENRKTNLPWDNRNRESCVQKKQKREKTNIHNGAILSDLFPIECH